MASAIENGNHVMLLYRGNEFALRVEPLYTITLGLPSRTREVLRRAKRVLKQAPACSIIKEGEAIEATFVRRQDAIIAADEIIKRLTAYVDEKLSAKDVEYLLNITSRERVRWTKDGRLPRSGTVFFKKGRQVFQVYLHPIDQIRDLLEKPEIIAEWRATDSISEVPEVVTTA